MARLMSKLTVSIAVVLTLASPAFATHKPGHQEPPACQNAQGNAPQNNKHCYPPPPNPQEQRGSKTVSFATPAARDGSGITVGMVVLAGLAGAGTLMLARRRRFTRLRRATE